MDNANKNTLTDRIARRLYEIDPMNTCCNVNEGMENEYIPEARQIAQLLGNGVVLRDAVKQTFDHMFWEGCLEEKTREAGLDTVVTSLASEQGEGK